MSDSHLHFGKEPDTRCFICARRVTLELSKTDELGRAVHEVCYVKETLEGLRTATLRALLPESSANRGMTAQAAAPAEFEMSFWAAFEFVRW